MPAPATLPSVLAQVEIDAARSFAEAGKAASIRRRYARDWDNFRAWCAARLVSPLPAEPATIADFLASEATAGRKASTIIHRTAAIRIRYGHQSGRPRAPDQQRTAPGPPWGHPADDRHRPRAQGSPTADVLTELLKYYRSESRIGTRDRALLALGLAAAFRRSELVAFKMEDLTECPDGLRVLIRQSKTDQEGAGQEIAILRGVRICPLEAVQVYVRRADGFKDYAGAAFL